MGNTYSESLSFAFKLYHVQSSLGAGEQIFNSETYKLPSIIIRRLVGKIIPKWLGKTGHYGNSSNFKRRNAIRYWIKGKSRGNRAVASHSKSDRYNLDAFSRYIPNEIGMHHLARKDLILPCGWTVKESWAALRKSWQGFMIAHSEGNTAKMKYYATFIHKVQQEMGIGLTVFDPGLVEDQDTATYLVPRETDNAEDQICTVTETSTQSEEDSLPDFEEIMSNRPKDAAIPNPREEIFATYVDRSQSSCHYSYEKANAKTPTNAAIRITRDEIFATYVDRSQSSCEYDYYANKSRVNVEIQKIHPESSCWNDPELLNSKLKKERKRQLRSCFYKSKGPSRNDGDSSQGTNESNPNQHISLGQS